MDTQKFSLGWLIVHLSRRDNNAALRQWLAKEGFMRLGKGPVFVRSCSRRDLAPARIARVTSLSPKARAWFTSRAAWERSHIRWGTETDRACYLPKEVPGGRILVMDTDARRAVTVTGSLRDLPAIAEKLNAGRALLLA